MSTAVCLDESTLVRFFAGDLPLAQLTDVEQHLDVCADCAGLIQAAAPLLAGVSGPGRLLQLPPMVEPGQLVVGRYRIEGLIGQGACGYVLRARDELAGLPVAVKLLRAERALQPVLLQLFTRELRVARALNHPHVCRVFDLQVSGEDRFLVMELGEGSLRDELRSGAAGTWTTEGRLADGAAIAAGLSAIHDAGIIHRDVKPENVLRLPDGRLVVSDFGLATLAPLGSSTRYVGTPLYMAPEVAAGEPATRASDIYSLGIVLHELFFDRRPAWRSQGARRVLARPPAASGRRERALFLLIADCLAEAPGQRPGDGRVVVRRLQAIADRRGLPRWGAPALPGRRAAMVAFSAALLLGGATFSLVGPPSRRRARQRARVMRPLRGNRLRPLPSNRLFEHASRLSFAHTGEMVVNRSPGPGFYLIARGSSTLEPIHELGTDAVLSPDGRLIAFVIEPFRDAPIVKDLYLLERETGRIARVARGSAPRWGAEGRLYYHDFQNRSVMVLNTAASHSQPMVFFGRTLGPWPSVSPDRKRIAFGAEEGLVIVDSYDGFEKLKWPAPECAGFVPSWSPDGKLLAFSSHRDDPLGVWVIDPNGMRRAVRVSAEPSAAPGWSLDGQTLTYDRTVGEIASVWSVSTDEIRRELPRGLTATEFELFARACGDIG